jgi:hypothetical protein
MALIDVIFSLQTPGPYTVTRTAAGAYTNGRYDAGSESTFTIIASIQPLGLAASGRVLTELPEGQNGDEVRILYTITELLTRSPGQEPDVVTLDGEDYYVVQTARWQAFGNEHWEVLVSRTVVP